MKINHLWFKLENEYGVDFGWGYIFFPEVETSEEEIRQLIVKNGGYKSSWLYTDPKTRSGFSSKEKISEERAWSQHDIWDQVRFFEVDSLEEAIKLYFSD